MDGENLFSPPPLSRAFGYGIIVGLGFLFAFGMIFTTWALKRYGHSRVGVVGFERSKD